ncbi:MAG: ATP-binding protein, partial [Prevotellaceae bacterium]|nr:ATP-binding protein [Prevotellaceae bacterium]
LERLKEERVRRVIEPMILGDEFINKESDDFRYTRDLGLIRVGSDRLIRPANPIYAEVMIRRLSSEAQEALLNPKYPYQMPRYLKDGHLDMNYLMSDFQQFWRANSDIWIERTDYREAAPHLVLMAFLQRIVNGGGQVIREMASGTGRLDLCLLYKDRKYPIELKIRYGNKYLEEGLEQTARYMGLHDCNEGWMVVFDRRPSVSWKKKIYMRKETVNGKTITIVGA